MRDRLIVAILGVALGVLLGAALFSSNPAGAFVRLPDGAIVKLIAVFEDGSSETLFDISSDASTNTPEPTATTPPTNTPRPTDIEPTPTPEGPIATSTPFATAPPKDVCYAGVTTTALNVRADHDVNSARVGQLKQAERVAVLALWVIFDPEPDIGEDDTITQWGMVQADTPTGFGWIAIEYNRNTYAVLDDVAACWELDIDSPGPAVPERPILRGPHLILGASIDALSSAIGGITAIKTTDTTEYIARVIRALKTSVVWTHRTLTTDNGMMDCPTLAQWYAPASWYASIRSRLPLDADYVEMINECGAPGGNWAQFADFTIAVLSMAGQDGHCMLWGSFATGNPDFEAWDELIRVIEWTNDHPCGPGKYHGLALHQTMYMPPDIARGPWVNDAYTSGRHVLVNAYLLRNHGVGLQDMRGPIWFTEYGLHDGYAGDWSLTFSCVDMARSLAYSIDRLEEMSPWVDGVHVWNWGNVPRWIDLSPCTAQIFGE